MQHRGDFELEDESILFVDDDLVAVDKPSGVLSDATRDPERDHLGSALKRWAARSLGPDGDRTFLAAHRLDLGTSGVVLFARNTSAATALMQQFQDRIVAKRYQAVVVASTDLDWQLGDTFERRSYLRHRSGRTEEVRSGGKPAHTRFEILDHSGPLVLVGAEPRTGRTHQLRVHLAALGTPILGDDRYGGPDEDRNSSDRLWLHAVSLELRHPISQSPLVITSRFEFVVDQRGPIQRLRR